MNPADDLLKIHPHEQMIFTARIDSIVKVLLMQEAKRMVPWYVFSKSKREQMYAENFLRLVADAQDQLNKAVDKSMKCV